VDKFIWKKDQERLELLVLYDGAYISHQIAVRTTNLRYKLEPKTTEHQSWSINVHQHGEA